MRLQNPALRQTKGLRPRWYIRPYVDVIVDGALTTRQERIYLGVCAEMPKREAIAEKNKALAKINRRDYVIRAQINFADLLDLYERDHVRKPENLSASTRAKYLSHLHKHIRPAFGTLRLAEITTQRIEALLTAKALDGLAYATRLDIRNILSGVFTQAERWGYWKERNPALHVNMGRRKAVWDGRKLTTEETRSLLEELPADVARICKAALYGALRISEVLGLTWGNVDFERGLLVIRQRYYRGDVDVTKSEKAERKVPLAPELGRELRALWPGEQAKDEYVFSVQTHPERKQPGQSRDDRDIHQHFLRPAAVKLGLYWKGFGFHAFRREAVTEIAARAGALQAQRMAGHSKADMSLEYTLADRVAQEKAVRSFEQAVMGKKRAVTAKVKSIEAGKKVG